MTAAYPDVEVELGALLVPFAAEDRVGTETPAIFTGLLPFIRITRRGGRDNGVTDFARVDIEVFTADGDRDAGQALIEAIRQFLTRSPAFRGDGPFDRIVCDSGPQRLPWSDQVIRWITSYTVSARRIDA